MDLATEIEGLSVRFSASFLGVFMPGSNRFYL